MADLLSRDLIVRADGTEIGSFNHACIKGMDVIGLEPFPFHLKLWNLSDSDFYGLKSAKQVSVGCGNAVLAAGRITEIGRVSTKDGSVTELVFSGDIPLWEARVSLAVPAGTALSETVRRILEASGTGVSLLSFPGEDPVSLRPQAFYGSASECIVTALSAARARCCLTPAGLCIIPAEGLPVSLHLSEEDLLDEPVPLTSGLLWLRTKPLGWPLGKTATVTWNGEETTGLIVERSLDADTLSGNWQSEIIVAEAQEAVQP